MDKHLKPKTNFLTFGKDQWPTETPNWVSPYSLMTVQQVPDAKPVVIINQWTVTCFRFDLVKV